jgi:hypothetical protein
MIIADAVVFPGANPTTSEFTTTAPASFKAEGNIFVFKMHYSDCGVVNIYNAGIVHNSRS